MSSRNITNFLNFNVDESVILVSDGHIAFQGLALVTCSFKFYISMSIQEMPNI